MTVELPVWQLLSIAVGILSGFAGLMKLLLGQLEKRLDGRFAAMDKEAERVRQLEMDFLRLQADMPLHYVRREDYVRNQTVIEAKLDALAVKLENVQLKGARE
ncbi:hypothetical protein [Pseudomonas sp. PS02288]|uniref:hypothetical protein n=1 Tax=Pseudomonas sp. PS02288 TaxID=2991443 RepID=UPI00249BACC3|nr:hypothetical protein [Pseudomonas sp. PS02288]